VSSRSVCAAYTVRAWCLCTSVLCVRAFRVCVCMVYVLAFCVCVVCAHVCVRGGHTHAHNTASAAAQTHTHARVCGRIVQKNFMPRVGAYCKKHEPAGSSQISEVAYS